jgi:hypothetical protein
MNNNQNLSEYSSVICEFVEYGLRLMKDIDSIPSDKIEQYLRIVLIAFLRHLIETLDAISILIQSSSLISCDILLRSIFETYLGLKFILKDQKERRAMFYIFCSMKERLMTNEELLDSNFQIIISADHFMKNTPLLDKKEHEQEIQLLKQAIERDVYKSIKKEYEAQLKKTKHPPHWYSLFDGPKGIKGLCKDIEIPAIYKVLYGSLSKTVHGADLITRYTFPNDDNAVSIYKLRSAKGINNTFTLSYSLSLDIFQAIATFIFSDKKHIDELAIWYVEGIRPRIMKLN